VLVDGAVVVVAADVVCFFVDGSVNVGGVAGWPAAGGRVTA